MLQVNVQRFWIYYNLSYNKTVYYDMFLRRTKKWNFDSFQDYIEIVAPLGWRFIDLQIVSCQCPELSKLTSVGQCPWGKSCYFPVDSESKHWGVS